MYYFKDKTGKYLSVSHGTVKLSRRSARMIILHNTGNVHKYITANDRGLTIHSDKLALGGKHPFEMVLYDAHSNSHILKYGDKCVYQDMSVKKCKRNNHLFIFTIENNKNNIPSENESNQNENSGNTEKESDELEESESSCDARKQPQHKNNKNNKKHSNKNFTFNPTTHPMFFNREESGFNDGKHKNHNINASFSEEENNSESEMRSHHRKNQRNFNEDSEKRNTGRHHKKGNMYQGSEIASDY